MQDFPTRLRTEMGKRGLTVYRLARLIDPEHPWRAERNLYFWLAGDKNPSDASRQNVAGALGLPPDFFRKGSELPVMEQMARNFTSRCRELVR